MSRTNFSNSIDFTGQKIFIGLDVHKSTWSVSLRCNGIPLKDFSQEPDAHRLVRTLKATYPGADFYSAYEAGFCGTGIHERLTELGVNNIIVHAADIPQTDKQRKTKTDLHDSRSIAQYLERGMLHSIHVLTREQQELRSLFRLRMTQVKEVTRANNRLKSLLNYYSVETPVEVSSHKGRITQKTLKWLDNLEQATAAGTTTLRYRIEELRYQRKRLLDTTRELRNQILATQKQTYDLLVSVPGIGGITAMALICELGDFNRFDDPDEFCSYLGLCPWEQSSGETNRTLGVNPRCNRVLRPLLIEASWVAIRNSPALLAYYCKFRIDSKKAIIKVARKLSLIAKGVVKTGQKYQDGHKPALQEKKIERTRGKGFVQAFKELHPIEQKGASHEPTP